MLCILAVFISVVLHEGAPRAMFVPLSLAVGFAMVASYLLSSTFVPVLSVWLLRHHPRQGEAGGMRDERRQENSDSSLIPPPSSFRCPAADVYAGAHAQRHAASLDRWFPATWSWSGW